MNRFHDGDRRRPRCRPAFWESLSLSLSPSLSPSLAPSDQKAVTHSAAAPLTHRLPVPGSGDQGKYSRVLRPPLLCAYGDTVEVGVEVGVEVEAGWWRWEGLNASGLLWGNTGNPTDGSGVSGGRKERLCFPEVKRAPDASVSLRRAHGTAASAASVSLRPPPPASARLRPPPPASAASARLRPPPPASASLRQPPAAPAAAPPPRAETSLTPCSTQWRREASCA
ncbi:hypothetical protein EYF80_057116 [Liparis tanakae]|uniref:Uncharacterized protein n=1 Tax=Liparis tanakae TaxID=230148 RepID=A0A4Z2EVA5_9TELE|nr:hypothetical protein EYF80_057116 [Liparis tanakae]